MAEVVAGNYNEPPLLASSPVLVLYPPDTKAHYFCQNHRPRYKTVLEMTLSSIQESQDT